MDNKSTFKLLTKVTVIGLAILTVVAFFFGTLIDGVIMASVSWIGLICIPPLNRYLEDERKN